LGGSALGAKDQRIINHQAALVTGTFHYFSSYRTKDDEASGGRLRYKGKTALKW
jgi:hypothetical protein